MVSIAKRVDEHVGERIRLRRTQLGLTQDQLAAALGISYQQIQKYETGANRVSAGRLFEIARKLDIDVSYFFADVDTSEARAEPLEHGGKNRSAIELVRFFSDIDDPAVRAAIAALVKSIVQEES